jgi:pimeloyl-ACP methyl ester carboxylesterase
MTAAPVKTGGPIYQPRRPPRHEICKVRGLEHRLTWWGEPSDTPVVLLHGWMDSSATWQFVVDCLPDSWTCVAPDWRGFGGSAWSPGGYWFPDYYADLEELLDIFVPHQPARVVAHSMGGNIAGMFAGIRPKRLAWLANLEGVGMRRVPPTGAPERYAEWLDQLKTESEQRIYPTLDLLVEVLLAKNPRLTAERARFVAAAWTHSVGTGVQLTADPAHRRVNPTLYRREEAEACWRRVEIPVLMLLGGLSEHLTRLGADCTEAYFKSLFRDIRVLTIPEVGHMMHHEDPQTVARHIVEFANGDL